MIRVNPKTGELTEHSLKQRQMIFAYAQDRGIGLHAINRRLQWVNEQSSPKSDKSLKSISPQIKR